MSQHSIQFHFATRSPLDGARRRGGEGEREIFPWEFSLSLFLSFSLSFVPSLFYLFSISFWNFEEEEERSRSGDANVVVITEMLNSKRASIPPSLSLCSTLWTSTIGEETSSPNKTSKKKYAHISTYRKMKQLFLLFFYTFFHPTTSITRLEKCTLGSSRYSIMCIS